MFKKTTTFISTQKDFFKNKTDVTKTKQINLKNRRMK